MSTPSTKRKKYASCLPSWLWFTFGWLYGILMVAVAFMVRYSAGA